MEIVGLSVNLQSFSYPAQGNATANASARNSNANSVAGVSSAAATSNSAANIYSEPFVSPSQLLQAIQQLNYLVGAGHDLNFSVGVDASTHQTVVRITDADSGDLIRQLPPAQAFAIAANQSTQPGQLISQTA